MNSLIYNLIYKNRFCLIRNNKINFKELRTNATSFSGSTQNEGNRKLLELSVQAFSSTIIPAVGMYYLYTILKEDTITKVQSNDSLIKANKEIAEKEIKAVKDLINANQDLINANKDLIIANKEIVEKEIKAIKEIAEKEIKAAKEIAENEIKAIKDLIGANKDLIIANKEMSIEMIKAYGANIENLILKK